MYDSSYIIEALVDMMEKQPKEDAVTFLTRAFTIMGVNDASELVPQINAYITDQFRNFIPYDELATLAMSKDNISLRAELQTRIQRASSRNSVESMLAACALSLVIQACAKYDQTFDDHTIGYVYEEAIIALN